MYLASLLCPLLVATACGNDGTRPAPSAIPSPEDPSDPTPPAAPTVPNVGVGDDVQDVFTVHGSAKLLELTVPSDGFLVVQLSWNATQGSRRSLSASCEWLRARIPRPIHLTTASRTDER